MTHLKIDPANGDYIIENGSPVETESLTVPGFYRLKVHRGAWLHAPDQEYGSEFYLLRKKRAGLDKSQIEDVAVRALQPIVDDGRASDIQVTAVAASRSGVGLDSTIVDARGTPETLNLPGV